MRTILLIVLFATGQVQAASIIICEGDSLTAGTGASAGSNYVSQMALFTTYGAYSTNIGGSGHLIVTNVSAFDTLRNLTNATAYGKKTVVFMMMINDIVVADDSVENVTTNYNIWADNVKGAFPEVKIMVLTQFDANVNGTELAKIASVNNWLRTNASGRFDYVADTAADPRLSDHTDTTYFNADGVHLANAGYAVVATIVRSNLLYHGRIFSDYYVRTDGNDSNLGFTNSSAGAWLTIGKAASTMIAGDTVQVQDGTYAETVNTGGSGSANHRITYNAQSTNVQVLSFTVDEAFNTINGFTIYGDTGVAGVLDGSVYVKAGGHNLVVTSNLFPSSAVSVPQIHVFYDTANQATNGFFGWNSLFHSWTHAVRFEGGGFHIAASNLLVNVNGYDAFRIAATNITIVGNTITNWSSAFVTSAPLKVGVRYYFVTTNGTMDFSNVGAGSPPYTEGEGVTFLCTNATPTSFGSAVLQLSNHPDIIQAFATDNTGTVPPNIPSRDLVFERNIVRDCTNGTQFGNLEDLGSNRIIDRWTFRNNVFVRIERTMNLYAPGFSFYNNTFYQCGTGSGWVVILNDTVKGTAEDLTVYNNLFVECGTATNPDNGWMAGDTAPNQLMNYNLVVGTGAGTTKGSSWTSGGFNANSINGSDPLFVNAAALDFRLQSGSPAIGTGTNLNSSFTTDFAGTTRGSVWDMGAFEFAAGGDTPTIVTNTAAGIRLRGWRGF